MPLKSKGLQIYHHNVCSILSKLDELKILFANSLVDIYGVTETHLCSNVPDGQLLIPGFNLHRQDRSGKRGGGIAAYVADHLSVSRRPDLESGNIESLWLEFIQPCTKSVLIAFVYRIPQALVHWFDLFEQELSLARCTGRQIIILGDFNIDLIKCVNPRWPELYESYGFTQLISEPTRITASCSTLIDHILVTDRNCVCESYCVTSVSMSDHFPIALTWNTKVNNNEGEKTITYRKFDKKNLPNLCENIANVLNMYIPEQIPDVNDLVDHFTDTLEKEYNNIAPIKERRVKRNHQPVWFNRKIADCIKLRNLHKRTGDVYSYKNTRNKCKILIKTAKINYYQQALSSAKGNSKKLWRYIRDLTRLEKVKPVVTNITHRSRVEYDPLKIANLFNVHFSDAANRVLDDAGITNDSNYTPSPQFKQFLVDKHCINKEFGIPLVTKKRNRSIPH